MSRRQHRKSVPFTAGPYQRIFESQICRYPNLGFLKEYLDWQQRLDYAESGRAVVIEFHAQSIGLVKFETSSALRQYLAEPRTCSQRLFILEDVAANYVEAIGSALFVNPYFFAAHARMTRWEAGSKMSTGPPLQSSQDPRTGFVLRYHELILANRIANSRGNALMYCDANVRRQIQWHEVSNGKSFRKPVATVQRSISYWSRRCGEGDWDSIILTDPPVGKYCLEDYRLALDVNDSQRVRVLDHGHRPELYQGGYIDFSAWPTNIRSLDQLQKTLLDGPTRESVMDDIIYYWIREGPRIRAPLSELDSTIFAKKIVLANWMVHLEYIQRCLREADQFYTDEVSQSDKTLGLWSRRWLIFAEQVQIDMLQLGLRENVAQGPQTRGDGAEDRPSKGRGILVSESYPGEYNDWAYVSSRLSFFLTRCMQLSSGVVARSSNQATRNMERMQKDSEEDNKNIALLTKLGALFVPLSFASGLLSMGGTFAAGQSHFWVYWAIATPLTLFLLLLAFSPSLRPDKRRYRQIRKEAFGQFSRWDQVYPRTEPAQEKLLLDKLRHE